MIFFYQLLFLILTYFVSSIPFGLILTKFFLNKDVRQSGSGNIGATNVVRIAGKKIGFLTLILDGAKGMVMLIAARFIFSNTSHLHSYLALIAFISVIGHVFPIYLNFKGGKGVATTIAVLLALDPAVGFLTIIFWIMAFLMFRISSIASLVATLSAVLLSIHYDSPASQLVLCIALFILITIRHKENIVRLLVGEENKM